jgi:DNA-binding transcriptional ArsR family regulator
LSPMPRALIPNSTQIPDVILDHWMAELSGAEFKVVLYIARRTYGFGKDSDTISLSQIATGLRRRDGRVLDRGTGASRSSVARSLKALEERGLVLRTTNLAESGREYDENTYSINLEWEPSTEPGGSPPGANKGEGEGVVSKSDYLGSGRDHPVSKSAGGWSQNGPGVVSKSDLQETEQETEQETAAAGKSDAAAELVSILVGKGVGHSVAVRLAREKPDDCRKYLDWLPFAEVKTTEGAWLVNAIRDGYGPPKSIAKQQAEEKRKNRAATANRDGPQSSQAERGDEKAGRLRETYARFFNTHPDAIPAFDAFFSGEREKTTKFAASLSEKARSEFDRNAETEEFRLSSFERWVRGEGRAYHSSSGETEGFSTGGSEDREGTNPMVNLAA